jgi:amino acid transporter
MRFVLPPIHRSRNPLVRVLSLIVGLAIVGFLMVFGLVVLSVLVIGGGALLAWRQWSRSRSPAGAAPVTRAMHEPDVLEGEFVVLNQSRHVPH